jgi:tRNA nucleotidyltransferase (CCA-adding enzyme)
MDVPDEQELLARVRALPAAGPLLSRLDEAPGVHLVGGAVRDLLMGGRPSDLDFVVEGDAAALAARLGGGLRVHDRFGTSTVTLDGFSYDFARARTETYPAPGALPLVAPASLADDLVRRDFTVNALAIALGPPAPGHLSAAPLALEDLEARRLRVLHEGSFIDDPTRLLRLVRYASRLGFSIEPATRTLAREARRTSALQSVSGARIGTELRLLAREPDPLAAFAALRELDLDSAIHPAFGIGDVALASAALELLAQAGRRDRLVLALAARAVPERELAELLESLSFEAGDRDAILAAATRADALAEALSKAGSPAQIARAAGGAGPELVALAGALGPRRAALDWLTRLRFVALEIGGADLLAAGIPEGPAIGRGLDAALAAKLDGEARGREQELVHALRAARANG